jgi:hypothetical protein
LEDFQARHWLRSAFILKAGGQRTSCPPNSGQGDSLSPDIFSLRFLNRSTLRVSIGGIYMPGIGRFEAPHRILISNRIISKSPMSRPDKCGLVAHGGAGGLAADLKRPAERMKNASNRFLHQSLGTFYWANEKPMRSAKRFQPSSHGERRTAILAVSESGLRASSPMSLRIPFSFRLILDPGRDRRA